MDKYDGHDFRSAICGVVATSQAAQQSKLIANLEIVGRAATSQKPQNKPAPDPEP